MKKVPLRIAAGVILLGVTLEVAAIGFYEIEKYRISRALQQYSAHLREITKNCPTKPQEPFYTCVQKALHNHA
jgi:hypothetical protein